ncbi:MAG: AMP-binding protein [Oscillospiraceae bacterium]|nr:AMP-binding protein [Oscillospiraceae bacterium]
MAIQTFDQLLRGGIEKHGNTSYVYEEAGDRGFIPHTYNEFYIDIRKTADKLISLGYGGKKIILYGANSYAWAVCYMAIIAYVGVVAPIDYVWGQNEILNVLNDISYDNSIRKNNNNSSDNDCDNSNGIALILHDRNLEINVDVPKISLQDKTLFKSSGDRIFVKNTDDIHKIVYTSGTTSRPKKVELTSRNLFANINALFEIFNMSSNDRILAIMPLHHITPVLSSLVYPFYLGINIYIASDYTKMMKYLRTVKPTLLFAVPKVYEKILERLPRILRPLLPFLFGGKARGLYSAAAVLNKITIETYQKWGLPLLQGYGSTETSAIVSVELLEGYKLGSVGRVLSNQDVKIINNEICVKGENVARDFLSEDGYFHTGDIGYLDDENWLYFVSRKKRLIKLSNGRNVYPDELEELLLQCGNIFSAHIFDNNDCVCAKIYANSVTDAESAINKVNDSIPYYMKIKEWEFGRDIKSSYKI